MTRQQIADCLGLAQSGNCPNVDDLPLHGIALPDYREGYANKGQIANFLRYHCAQFNGGWDSQECENIVYLLRKKVMMIA